jgi:hypothetical protein
MTALSRRHVLAGAAATVAAAALPAVAVAEATPDAGFAAVFPGNGLRMAMKAMQEVHDYENASRNMRAMIAMRRVYWIDDDYSRDVRARIESGEIVFSVQLVDVAQGSRDA